MKEILKGFLLAGFIFLVGMLIYKHALGGEYLGQYAKTDSVRLEVGCLDTTFLEVADPDSVWFYWYRDATAVGSLKVSSPYSYPEAHLGTGDVSLKIRASDGTNTGQYTARAIVHKWTRAGIKKFSWKVLSDYTDDHTPYGDTLGLIHDKTTNLPSDPADQSLIMTEVDSAEEHIEDIYNIVNDGTFGNSALETLVDEIESLLKNATYGLSALETLVDDIESRLTAARAGKLDSLDNLTGDSYSIVSDGTYGNSAIENLVDEIESLLKNATYGLAALEALVDDLETRLTATRAGYLDTIPTINVDAESLQAGITRIETETGAIKPKTDALPSDPADASDVAAAFADLDDSTHAIRTDIATAQESLDVANTEIDAAQAQVVTVQTDLDNPNQYKATVPDSIPGPYANMKIQAGLSADSTTAGDSSHVYIDDQKDMASLAGDSAKANILSDATPFKGAFVDTNISSINIAITGDNIVQITVCDSTDSSGISGYKVSLYDSSDTDYTTRLSRGWTDGVGMVEFHVAADTYRVHFWHPPWWEPDTVIVVQDTSVVQQWTLYASIPGIENRVHIYGFVYEMDGDGASGATVEISLNTKQRVHYATLSGKKAAWPDPLELTTDSQGYWHTYVPPSNGFYSRTGSGWTSISVDYVLRTYGTDVVSRRSTITLPAINDFEW